MKKKKNKRNRNSTDVILMLMHSQYTNMFLLKLLPNDQVTILDRLSIIKYDE